MKPGAFALNPHAASYVPLSKRMDCGRGDDGLVFAMAPAQQISFSGVEVSMQKKSSEMAYKQIRDDDLDIEMDIDMDIEYLLVTFSGLSQESITDVYLANSGDLEATIEMLNQLEIYSTESQENLPETLDIGIGDISESGPSTSKASEVVASSSSVIPTNAPVSA
ncbi:PREDICTED: polyadenylate-binding protein-interacting protein 5-like [Camelina sativa]|uniref:Polyadenylate-binding protein-interacting protein 5-like n=1 Tax=Camelina sativa TaxID=90675 RepID=A0ABM0T1Y7_CAMSA|nr:PREDICTED: polyadenylate-binding protein-interacting protein 5-like [Camelina sativa]XP_010419715.1 PREDICTED: polyadenylate-binding protein-interacting protein 5-like [Camelina sativa]